MGRKGGAPKHMKSLWVLRSWALRGKLEIALGCFSRRRASWYRSVCVRVRVSGWRGGAAKHMKFLYGFQRVARSEEIWKSLAAVSLGCGRYGTGLGACACACACVRAVVAALAFAHAPRLGENRQFFGSFLSRLRFLSGSAGAKVFALAVARKPQKNSLRASRGALALNKNNAKSSLRGAREKR